MSFKSAPESNHCFNLDQTSRGIRRSDNNCVGINESSSVIKNIDYCEKNNTSRNNHASSKEKNSWSPSMARHYEYNVINCKFVTDTQTKCETSCDGFSKLINNRNSSDSKNSKHQQRIGIEFLQNNNLKINYGYEELSLKRNAGGGQQKCFPIKLINNHHQSPRPPVQQSIFILLLKMLTFCSLLHLMSITSVVECQSLVVSTEAGRIRGILGTSRDGRSYSSFLGIPYAQPPINELRFEPPQPSLGWSGIRSTSQFGPECLQMDVIITGRLTGSEDCLYLNVFTPWIMQRRAERSLLPVLVFIHGGFFMSGSANTYRGKYFMDQDVVLVTINYRLGAFGFLNVGGESNIKGNMGMKDQTLALKWIQRNIHKFGGDPKQVTIFGESVGGASVQYHMISPLSKGLFQKGISQSGTAARNYMLTEDAAGQAKHLARRLGCPTKDLKRMGDCLRRADAQEIVHVHKEAISPEREEYAFYGPTIEEEHEGAFFTRDPRELYRNGNFSKLPLITGIDSGEGLFYVAQILREYGMLADFETNWDSYLPRLLNYNGTKHPAAARQIRSYYFGNTAQLRLRKNLQNFTNMFSDRMFFLPTKEGALLSSKYAPTFMYYFNYETPISIYDLILGMNPNVGILQELELAAYMTRRWLQQNIFGPKPKFLGSSHGDELSILFDTHLLSEIRRGSPHYRFSKEMVKLWADFARDETSMKFFGTKWPQIQPNVPTPVYLELGPKGRLISEPFKDRMDFWTSLNLGDYLYS